MRPGKYPDAYLTLSAAGIVFSVKDLYRTDVRLPQENLANCKIFNF